MSALRAGIALCAVSLAACNNLLGIHDITPDGEPFALSISSEITGVAHQPMSVITVLVMDVRGAAVDFTGEVKLALGDNPGGATLLGTVTATVRSGRADFDGVGIDKPGTYTLIASAEGLPSVTSNAIEIVAPRFVPVPTGLAGGPIASVAVSPAVAGGTTTVFAGARDGVYRSVDRGANWKLAGFGGHIDGNLVADPSRPGVLYSWRYPDLKKTTDGGATWHNLETGQSVALDPRNPSVVYAAAPKLRRSTDGGASWTDVNSQTCSQIVIDPVAGTLYCKGYTRSGMLSIFRSSNGGADWDVTIDFGAPNSIGNMAATPSGVFVLANGTLYRSINAGGVWASITQGDARALAYAPSMPNRIYLAIETGMAVSNDGGVSFGTPVDVGDRIQSVAVDPTNPDVVYGAGARFGVQVSTNGGASWSLSSKGIDANPIISTAMVPGTVLATTERGALRTTNGGTSWTTVSPLVGTVRFDPAASTRAYLCGFTAFATSVNSGASFTGGTVASLFNFCSQLLVAGTTLFSVGSGQIYKSIDSGANWTNTNLGMTVSVNDAALADPSGNVVVAATAEGIHRSTNGGTSFTRVLDGYTYAIAADPKAPTHIIASQCATLRLSTDAGASFRILSGPCVHKLFTTGSTLYAVGFASDSTTIMQTSTDGGATWKPADITGIPRSIGNLDITSIAASDDGQTVYLGTPSGLYKSVR